MTSPIPLLLAGTLACLLSPHVRAADEAAGDAPLEPVRVRAVAHFDFDRATLEPADRASILADVSRMKDVSWQSVGTIGHTDDVGPPAYNDALARRRAQAVKAYMVAAGLDATMIAVDAKGESAPVADNATAEGRAQNRRTEIEFRGVRRAAR